MTLPSVMLIAGRAGFGKSHMARRLAQEHDAAVVACRGRTSAVREILAVLSNGTITPGSASAASLAQTIGSLIGGSAAVPGHCQTSPDQETPRRMLILDDADCVDSASQRALRCLLADMPSGAQLVLTFTPGGLSWVDELESAAIAVTRIELQTLSTMEVAELAGVEAAEEIRAWTGGVPWLVAAALAYRDGLPPAVREQVSSRLAQLSPTGGSVAETLCQLRGPAGVSLLAKAGGHTVAEVASALDEVVRAELAVERPQGTFRCTPPIISEAICLSTPPSRRREINASLTAAMAHRADGEQIHHARATGDFVMLAEVVEQRARRLRTHGDYSGGSALLRELLSEPDLPDAVRAAVAGRLRRLAVSSVECAETMALLRGILADETLPVGLRGELRLELGLLLLNQAGDPDGGRDELTRAVGELRRRPILAARAMSTLAVPLWGSCHVSEHSRWLEQSHRVCPVRGEEALLTATKVNQIYARMAVGDPSVWPDAAGLPAEAATDAVRHQLLRGYANFAGSAIALGHYSRAESFLGRADRLADRLGPLYARTVNACNRLRLALACGDWAGLAERAEVHLRTATNPYAASTAKLVLGVLATSRGEWGEARQHLDDPVLRSEAGRLGAEEVEAAAARIRLALLENSPGDAMSTLDEAVRGVRVKGIWAWAAPLVQVGVRAMMHTGENAEAKRLVAEFAADVSTRDYPHATATILGAQAMIAARQEDATQLFRLAAARYANLPRPYEQAQMLEATGAVDALVVANQIFTGLGATFDAARIAQLLRELGESPPGVRRGRRGYGTQLSPREQEVARLMEAGRTNREIAHTLFLSPRTVEQHVAQVLRKLGATTRNQVKLINT